MKLKAKFKVSDLARDLDMKVSQIEQMIQNELVYIGLEFVRNARIQADFKDHTGNLRSSIGFMLLKNGRPVFEDFQLSQKGTDRKTGRDTAWEYAFAHAKSITGFVLICVAGMEYAVFVEANGFDVITSSALKAEDNLTKDLEKLNKLLNQKK